MCTSSVSNVIYHKFPHGTVSYTLGEENINVMLELHVNWDTQTPEAEIRTRWKGIVAKSSMVP